MKFFKFNPIKKIITSLLFLVPLVSFTQEKIVWDYPVKPGMEEWKQFKSTDDMYQACQIPNVILGQLNTEELVDVCLNFPAPPQFLFYNTPQEGFISYYSNFNGIRELFNHRDAGHFLLKKYTEMSLSDFNPLWPLHIQGQYISHYKFVETVLAQTQVIQTLSPVEMRLLLKETIRKMDEKLSKSDLFSSNNIEINSWIMAKLLAHENKLSIQNREKDDVQMFLDSGLLVNVDITSIYKQAKKYSYENNNE
jgi:hypothetical protein